MKGDIWNTCHMPLYTSILQETLDLTSFFASSIVETDIERLFFCKLVEDQVPVTIRSNRSMEV